MKDKHDTLARSRRIYLAENAIGSLIFSMVTGGFFAGLLSWLGASPATCALVGAFPQLGCMLMALSSLCWFCLPVSLAWLAPLLQCISTAGGSAYSMANVNLQYVSCPDEGKTAYLGVTAAASNIVGYAAVMFGAQLQPLLAQRLDRLGIPVLFLLSATAYAVCLLCTRRITDA